jgi:peroxiredoxin
MRVSLSSRTIVPRVLLVALTLSIGCRTSSEPAPPPQEPTSGGGGPAVAVEGDGGAGGAGGGDPAEAGELAGAAASEGGEPREGEGGEPREDETPDAVAATPGAQTTTAAIEPLPAPLFASPANSKKSDARCGQDPGVGEAARPFTLKTPEGQELSLASLRGKVVLLNFWGTWCKPCLEELPEFDRLYRRYRKHGLVVVAVATDSDPAPVQDFAKLRKLATKLVIGGEAHANAYKSPNFPFTFVVDAKGVIRGSYRGYKPECMSKLEADLRAELEKLRPKK